MPNKIIQIPNKLIVRKFQYNCVNSSFNKPAQYDKYPNFYKYLQYHTRLRVKPLIHGQLNTKAF